MNATLNQDQVSDINVSEFDSESESESDSESEFDSEEEEEEEEIADIFDLLTTQQYDVLMSWNQDNWARVRLLDDTKLTALVISTNNITVIRLCFKNMPKLKCNIDNLKEVLLRVNENSPCFKFVLSNLKHNNIKPSLAKLNLSPFQVSVKLLQKACRAGVNMDSCANLITELGRTIATSSRCNAHAHSYKSQMIRGLRYLLIHSKIPKNTMYGIVRHAYRHQHNILLEIYSHNLTIAQVKEIEANHTDAFGLGKMFMDMKTTKMVNRLANFVDRELQVGGSLDKLLYAPPTGLIIKRNITMYCSS